MSRILPGVARRLVGAQATGLLIVGAVLLSTVVPDVAAARASPVGPAMPGIEYAAFDGEPLLLDVYTPDGIGEAVPAVIFVHGGGFREGNRRMMRRAALDATRRGWVGISIDYRLTETPGHPGEVSDVRAAVAWARAHADTLGVDPDRIALYGTSAGGTLASLAGVMPTGPLDQGERVKGVVSFSGVMDLVNLVEEVGPRSHPARTVENYLGCTPDVCPDLYREASPIVHVSEDDPPHFVAQSTEEMIPASQGVAMADALESVGVRGHLELVDGSLHGSALDRLDVHRDAAFEFLEELFVLEPDAPAQDDDPGSTTLVQDDDPGSNASVQDDDSTADGLPTWAWVGIGGVFVVAVSVIAALLRGRRRRP
jgi:acetyl esterase